MSRENDRNSGTNQPTPEAIQALRALATLPRPRPTERAREVARDSFLRGDPPSLPESDRPTVLRPDLPERPGRRRRRLRGWLALPLAAVIVAAVGLTWFGLQPVGSWRIIDVLGPEGVTVAADRLTPGSPVAAGPVVTAIGSELELQFADELRFRMLPGTWMKLPEGPGRWFGRSRTLTILRGEIYGTTADQRLDFPLTFETPELTAELTGTTFAVFRRPEGSCVCLWNGGVAVTRKDTGETIRLQPETRLFVYKDGRPSLPEPLSDMERMKLDMMHGGGIAP